MNETHTVFLDTSILPRGLRLDGQGITELIELVKAGIIEIHVSEVAAAEWTSQMESGLKKRSKELASAYQNLLRFAPEVMLGKTLGTVSQDIAHLTQISRTLARNRVEFVLKKLNARTIPVDGMASSRVFRDYFDGESPFKQPKNRSDLPDAFILDALKILTQEKSVYVGVQDKALAKAVEQIENAIVFEDLKSLAGNFREQLDEANHFQSLVELLKKDEKRLISKMTPVLEKQFENIEVNDDSIPSDNGDAMVMGYGGFDSWNFNWSDASDYGGGWVNVPFSFQVELDLHFFVFRGNAFDVPDWVSVDIGDFEEDHSFEAGGSRSFDCTASVSAKFSDVEIQKLQFPKDLEVDDLEIFGSEDDWDRSMY